MSLIIPFVVGVVVGVSVQWQMSRRAKQHTESNLSQQLASANVEIQQLKTSKAAPPPPAAKQRDRLEKIKGIGPVFGRRLREAGITSFADIAAMTPEQIVKIVTPNQSESIIDPQSWIDQARQLAK